MNLVMFAKDKQKCLSVWLSVSDGVKRFSGARGSIQRRNFIKCFTPLHHLHAFLVVDKIFVVEIEPSSYVTRIVHGFQKSPDEILANSIIAALIS